MSEHAKSFAFGDWTLNDILNDQRPELKNALFRIPDYQGGYAWEKRQLEEFWEDLHSKRKSHYMGAITEHRLHKSLGVVLDTCRKLVLCLLKIKKQLHSL